MVNPFHTVGQAAADLVQKLDDEERAARVALCRVAAPTTLSDMLSGKGGKTFDDHKADALLEIQAERAAQQRTAALLADAERVRKAAQQRTAALLADAEREGRESALAAHMAKQGAKPPPATEPVRQPALTFEQARMEVCVEIDARQQFSRDLAAGASHKPQEVYIDEAARRYLAAQPAPATPQPAPHLPEQAKPVQIKRGNLLQILIDEAVKADGIDHMRVFSRLREWASEKPPRQPLLGVTEEGIQWVDSNDKGKTLSLDALSKRLKRRR